MERIINSHPEVLASIVYPVADPQFGTVLNTHVELIPNSSTTIDDLKTWLRPRLSRAEMPHLFSLQPVTISATGKNVRDRADRQ